MGATAALAGTALQAGGRIYSGIKTAQADRYSADLLNQEAGQSVASGIQGLIMQRRRGTYVASSARARIAGSGLTTTGTSALDVVSQIRGQSEYQALTQLYQGEDRALELGVRASGLRDEAGAAEFSGWAGGISSVLTGGTDFAEKYPNFFSKYGYGSPRASSSGGDPLGLYAPG